MHDHGWEYEGIRTPPPVSQKPKKVMTDYRRTPLKEGDKVAIYWGYNDLKTGTVVKIRGVRCKVEVDGTVSKWKTGCCMVKLED